MATSMTANNIHVGIYERSVTMTTSVYSISAYSGSATNRIFINPRRTGTNIGQFGIVSGLSGATGAGPGAGLYLVNKKPTQPATLSVYQNGVSMDPGTAPTSNGSVLPTGNVVFGGFLTPPATLSAARGANVAFATIGSSLDVTQQNTYFQIIQSFLTDVGAAV